MKFYEVDYEIPIPIMKFTDKDGYFLQVVCYNVFYGDGSRKVGLQGDPDKYPAFDANQWEMINKAISAYLIHGGIVLPKEIEDRMEVNK